MFKRANGQVIPCNVITDCFRTCLLSFRQVYLQGDGFRKDRSRFSAYNALSVQIRFRSLVLARTYFSFTLLIFYQTTTKYATDFCTLAKSNLENAFFEGGGREALRVNKPPLLIEATLWKKCRYIRPYCFAKSANSRRLLWLQK